MTQQRVIQSQKEVRKQKYLRHFSFSPSGAVTSGPSLLPPIVISRVFLCLAIVNAVRRGRVSLECPIAPRANNVSGQRVPC